MSVLTGRAELLARQLHEGHIDKNDVPIIEHVVRVVEAVRRRCLNDETAEIVAWLHPQSKTPLAP